MPKNCTTREKVSECPPGTSWYLSVTYDANGKIVPMPSIWPDKIITSRIETSPDGKLGIKRTPVDGPEYWELFEPVSQSELLKGAGLRIDMVPVDASDH